MAGVWKPFSNAAYGANALYIPHWGTAESYEFIFGLTQNFPTFKTHPTLDVWHMYNTGTERFEQSLEYRVTPWVTDLPQGAWSFLYLPERDNAVRGLLRFFSGNGNRLRVLIEFTNPSEIDREWQLEIFFCRTETARLEEFNFEPVQPDHLNFSTGAQKFQLQCRNLNLASAQLTDSNSWIKFPFNVENSYFPTVRNDRFRDRFNITTAPVQIPAGSTFQGELELIPPEAANTPRPEVLNLPLPADEALPYMHEIWESQHNQEYVPAFNHPGAVARPIPARQWGNFWFWDTGFVAYAAADFAPEWAAEILRELPEPENCPRSAGSYIPTGIDALWHLYETTDNRPLLQELYPKMARMMRYWQQESAVKSEPGMYNKNRGAGSDDNPCSCYCSNFVFSWGYHRTLPRNAQHRNLECIDIEVTSAVIHYLRQLRMIATVLQLPEDIAQYSRDIAQSEQALESHWSESHGCFLYRAGGEDHLLDIEWIGCYNPLYAGVALSAQRRQRMLANLTDPHRYWSPYGLTAVAFDNPNFRSGGYPNGCVWAPNQFYYWRGFYDLGETARAQELLDHYLAMFEANHQRDLMCWEQFRATSGRGTGNARFSSFVTPIVSMWKSRTEPFYVTVGFETRIVHKDFNNPQKLQLSLQRPFASGRTGCSVVLDRPGRGEIICNGQKLQDFVTNARGLVTWNFDAPSDKIYNFEINIL